MLVADVARWQSAHWSGNIYAGKKQYKMGGGVMGIYCVAVVDQDSKYRSQNLPGKAGNRFNFFCRFFCIEFPKGAITARLGLKDHYI